jgi:hypothetical protein
MKKLVFLVLIVLLAISTIGYSNNYITVKSKMKCTSGAGWPPSDLSWTKWISPKGFRIDYGEGMHLLFIAEKSSFYLLYPDKKEYTKLQFNVIKRSMTLIDETIEITKVKTQNTGKLGNIGQWKAEIWNLIPQDNVKIEVWISKKFRIPPYFKKFSDEIIKFQGKVGLVTKEILKMDGIVLKRIATASTVLGSEYVTVFVVTDISTKKIPDSIFEIPKKYTEVPFRYPARYLTAFHNIW